MKAKVTLYNNKINKILANHIKAAKMVGEQMVHEIVTEQRMPFDEGTLQNVQTTVDSKLATSHGVIKIIHDTPYATRLYYNPQYNFDKTINARAGGEWWDDWLVGSKKERPMFLFKHFYSKLLKKV